MNRRDESGQIALGLVLLVMVLLLVLAVQVFIPFGEATDQRAGSRAAADAAALAAAGQIRDDLPGALADALEDVRDADDLLGVMNAVGGGFGRQEAAAYAEHNDADLIEYTYSRAEGRIDVRIRNHDVAANGQQAESTASADLGLRLGACRLPDQPAENEDENEDEPQDPDEPVPADTETVLRCGDLVLDFTIDGETGIPTLTSDLDDLQDGLRPRLIA